MTRSACCVVIAWFAWTLTSSVVRAEDSPAREVINGISTSRTIAGKPYELAGKRIVFTSWYYLDPGDLDWRDDDGQSVYVKGKSGPLEAHHIGIRAPRGIRLIVVKPTVTDPMFRPNRCIIQDGDIYKGWTDNEYYESSDAMHWEKKANVSYTGRKFGDGIYHVFIDPSAAPEERFKSIIADSMNREEFEAFRKKRPDGWEPRALLHAAEDQKVDCIRGGVSPDGITWTVFNDPLVVDYCDTLNTCCYDEGLRKYVMYTRTWDVGPQSTKVPVNIRNSWTDVGRRAVGRSESSDFRSFPVPKTLLEPAPDMLPSEQIYTNCHTTVPGAPDQQLLFPAIWNASVTDTTHIAMLSSHDGQVWHWLQGGNPVLETQDFGKWNGGCVWVHPDLIEMPSGDWALPYSGSNIPHKYPRGQMGGGLGYAIWPKGRMTGLEAADQGQFTMIPLISKGRTLRINALTLRAGWVKVGVYGKNGRGIDECVPIVGDQAWTKVAWKDGDDMGIEPGQAVAIVIELYQAKLFGLEFE